ncbi:MAG: RNA polymerase factor sigma-32 [Deltaproteobacteria bacterium]|nr:RNA polymerase factor sigma-32 [Deltaproteobacteria bacterium]
MNLPVLSDSLQTYLVQISRFPLINKEEEFELAVRFRKYGDIEAAHQLVTSNLRFVVKIAMEYKDYGCKLADLIQEGNIGLMKAVKRFDPYKGYRLITYAVWWIKAHIQAFIIKSWSLVSRGAQGLKKRLFCQLNSTKEAIQEMDGLKSLSSSEEVGHDLSLNEGIGEEETTYLDVLPDERANPEETIATIEERAIVKQNITTALARLNEKERFILEQRVMADNPLTLQEIGNRLGVSRERVRQIEEEAIRKLRRELVDTDH